jgi:hypothetical protein
MKYHVHNHLHRDFPSTISNQQSAISNAPPAGNACNAPLK